MLKLKTLNKTIYIMNSFESQMVHIKYITVPLVNFIKRTFVIKHKTNIQDYNMLGFRK